MKILLIAAVAVVVVHQAEVAPIFPETIGTRWEYQLTDSSAGAPRQTVVVAIVGREKINGTDALKLETRVDNILTKTEFLEANERGVFCLRRSAPDGKSVDFEPPQEMIPAVLKFDAQWELEDEIAGKKVHQQFTVKVEDDLVVPAGKFHTFLCECDQPWPISITIQRWLSPGVGLVKEVTTTRGPTGRLLSRVTTALHKFSEGTIPPPNEKNSPLPPVLPTASVIQASPKITLAVSKERDGEPTAEFRSDAPNIFVRWIGENLPVDGLIRVAWIAEDVGDLADPNFLIDQSETIAGAAKSRTQFTLSRPKDGWAPGKYRVDVYLDEKLIESAKITIAE